MAKEKLFATEAEMCAQFISAVGDDWVVYPETWGDILLVRKVDGFQIGIEAKLRLTTEVVNQVLEDRYPIRSGPDCRAVLVPRDASGDFSTIASYIGFTVIRCGKPQWKHDRTFSPELPDIKYDNDWRKEWHELCPESRVPLPEYVPDVVAGDSAPLQLTKWKIAAIKIAIILERRGYVLRPDFKHVGIDYRRWIARESGWLVREERGWVAGKYLPNFKAQHPKVWGEIEADAAKWMPPEPAALLERGAA